MLSTKRRGLSIVAHPRTVLHGQHHCNNTQLDRRFITLQVFANWSQEQTDGTYKTLLNGPLAKFDMECALFCHLPPAVTRACRSKAQHHVARGKLHAVGC